MKCSSQQGVKDGPCPPALVVLYTSGQDKTSPPCPAAAFATASQAESSEAEERPPPGPPPFPARQYNGKQSPQRFCTWCRKRLPTSEWSRAAACNRCGGEGHVVCFNLHCSAIHGDKHACLTIAQCRARLEEKRRTRVWRIPEEGRPRRIDFHDWGAADL